MTQCKFDQFKATSTPPLRRTQVMFCACKACGAARAANELWTGQFPFRPLEHVKTRVEALRWKPEPPKEETDGDAA
jgi:hypothetical protein